MSAKKIKRNVAEVSFQPPEKWDGGVESPSGSTTYTSTQAGGEVVITFLDSRTAQVHSDCPVGTKVKESAAGSVHVVVP